MSIRIVAALLALACCGAQPLSVLDPAIIGARRGGIDALPSSITINGATQTPIIDCRGKNASAAGWVCTGDSAATLAKTGSTAAMTYGGASPTASAVDVTVTFNGAGANTDEHFASATSATADVTTEDTVQEMLVRPGDISAARLIWSKISGTAGHWQFFSSAGLISTRLTTSSTTTDVNTPAPLPHTANIWMYCTTCTDRDSVTGFSMSCNGQTTVVPSNFSARSASLTNASVFALGASYASATRFVLNGKIALFREWVRASWFDSSTSTARDNCLALNKSRLRTIAAKDYLFIGDSTTAGTADTSPITRWPSAYTESTSTIVAAINEAISGKTCAELYAGPWATEKGNGYQRLYLLCGVNDIQAEGASAATIEGRITTYITEAHARGIDIVVGTPMPYKNAAAWTSGGQTTLDSLNTWILANSAGADYVVDLYSAMENTPGDDLLKAAYDSGDHLHPNQAGHEAMAAAVTAVLAP